MERCKAFQVIYGNRTGKQRISKRERERPTESEHRLQGFSKEQFLVILENGSKRSSI